LLTTQIQKDKYLFLNYDESKSTKLLNSQRLDLTQLNYIECMYHRACSQKKAWDFVIYFGKASGSRAERADHFAAELELFDANLKLERLPEAIE